MPQPGKSLFISDILDSQIEDMDQVKIGRVADLALTQVEDGTLVLTYIMTGPQTLAGRISPHLQRVLRFVLRDHFEHQVPLSEVTDFGPTLRLSKEASQYAVGQSERWLARVLLRWLPGSGY